jgi:pilus assembly protein CpaB
LRTEDVRWAPARSEAPLPGEIIRPSAERRHAKPEIDEEARAEVRGTGLRQNVMAGSPVQRGSLVKPGDRDFLRIVLVPGSRAVSVPVPAGVGLLYPGDRVDIILTQTFRTDTPASRRSVSETIAEELRILAIEGAKADNPARTVILEVVSEQAEKLNVANELGKLTLALRGSGPGRGDDTTVAAAEKPGKPIWAGDVSPALIDPAPPSPPLVVDRAVINVLHGTKLEQTIK